MKFLSDNFGNGLSSYFPLYTRGTRSDALFQNSSELEPNLSENARKYVVGVNGSAPEVFHHALATLHTPAFRHENLSALRQDWPRVPLPAQHQHLEESADLGHEVAGLLDPDADVTGVTAGSIRPELRFLGVVRRVGGGSLSESDLRLTVGWGFAGRNGVVMPGKGLLSPRGYTDKEREAIERGAAAFGIDEQAAFGLLGEGCVDVYANEKAYWSCVPARVWNYYLGGYQVIKKWLSYREYDLLGRPLKLDEARGLRDMVRRISALRLLEPALDANYRKVCENAYPWPAESR